MSAFDAPIRRHTRSFVFHAPPRVPGCDLFSKSYTRAGLDREGESVIAARRTIHSDFLSEPLCCQRWLGTDQWRRGNCQDKIAIFGMVHIRPPFLRDQMCPGIGLWHVTASWAPWYFLRWHLRDSHRDLGQIVLRDLVTKL